jgi:hypothetical protein
VTAKESILFDTNVLVYATNEDSPFFEVAKELRQKALVGEIRACITPQILAEYYSVVTSPRRVTKPLSPKQAREEVEAYLQADAIRKLPIQSSASAQMVELADRYRVREQGIYDVQLVATMLDHGVKSIYTANEKDFERFKEIQVINPFTPSEPS